MNETELKSHLRQLDLQPSRNLGQNFLVDDNVSRWIAAQLEVAEGDRVVEIGPGFGALTHFLAGRGASLTLIEKDGRLAGFLEEIYASGGVEIHHGDATRFDVRELFRSGPVKLIGNLPYSAGTEITRNFLDQPSPVSRAVFMLQKEVAERFCARPRTKSYGALSVIMQAGWDIVQVKTVGPQLFFPRPEVDSAVIRLAPRKEESLPRYSPEVFVRTVKQGFSRRRKQLHNNLPVSGERWEEICRSLGFKPGVRAEELDVADWVNLSNELEVHPCHDLPPSAEEELEFVDEADVVLGKMPRRRIHEEKKLHRAVHIFVRNKRGDLFLQRRSAFKDTHPGKWDSSASGHVDPGESYEDCALRELWEELWIRPKSPLVKRLRIEASEATDLEFIEVFEAQSAEKIRVHTSEIQGGRFFSIEQIDRWMAERPSDFATGFTTCYRAWREIGD